MPTPKSPDAEKVEPRGVRGAAHWSFQLRYVDKVERSVVDRAFDAVCERVMGSAWREANEPHDDRMGRRG